MGQSVVHLKRKAALKKQLPCPLGTCPLSPHTQGELNGHCRRAAQGLTPPPGCLVFRCLLTLVRGVTPESFGPILPVAVTDEVRLATAGAATAGTATTAAGSFFLLPAKARLVGADS